MKPRVAMILVLLLAFAAVARADNAAGKITIVQVTSNGTRFFMQAQGLSLFATTTDAREVLLGAFYRKASINVSFTKITCPGGITGTCGNVTFVSVDASAIP